MRWERQPKHEEAVLRRLPPDYPEAAIPKVYYGYEGDEEVLHALISREEIAIGDWRWHISVSAEGRVPAWEELAASGHELRPGVPFVVGVPPKSWWINVHPHVLHLYESKDQPLLDQWRSERRGDRPT